MTEESVNPEIDALESTRDNTKKTAAEAMKRFDQGKARTLNRRRFLERLGIGGAAAILGGAAVVKSLESSPVANTVNDNADHKDTAEVENDQSFETEIGSAILDGYRVIFDGPSLLKRFDALGIQQATVSPVYDNVSLPDLLSHTIDLQDLTSGTPTEHYIPFLPLTPDEKVKLQITIDGARKGSIYDIDLGASSQKEQDSESESNEGDPSNSVFIENSPHENTFLTSVARQKLRDIGDAIKPFGQKVKIVTSRDPSPAATPVYIDGEEIFLLSLPIEPFVGLGDFPKQREVTTKAVHEALSFVVSKITDTSRYDEEVVADVLDNLQIFGKNKASYDSLISPVASSVGHGAPSHPTEITHNFFDIGQYINTLFVAEKLNPGGMFKSKIDMLVGAIEILHFVNSEQIRDIFNQLPDGQKKYVGALLQSTVNIVSYAAREPIDGLISEEKRNLVKALNLSLI